MKNANERKREMSRSHLVAEAHNNTHWRIVDSLAVQNAVLNLLPADQRNTMTTRDTLQQILKSASSFEADEDFMGQGRAEGNVLENTLNALGALMLGPEQWNALRGDPGGNTWSRIDDATHADDDGEWVTFSGREHFYAALDKLLKSDACLTDAANTTYWGAAA